jgi:soluble lytic murein transglycosylase-like protein
VTRRTSVVLRVLSCLVIAAEILLFRALQERVTAEAERVTEQPPVTETIPGLARQRHLMMAAQSALRDGDGERALAALEAMSLGGRPVETYRQYYLANARELAGMRAEARATLARLWASSPDFAPRVDVGFHLAGLYEEEGDWNAARGVLEVLARDDSPEVSDAAYQRVRACLVATGDPSGIGGLARDLAVRHAGSPAGNRGAADLAVLGGSLPRVERIDRVVKLAGKGDPARVLDEVGQLRRAGTTTRLEQARALALARQGKREDADRIVLALVGQSRALDAELLASSFRWWSEAVRSIEERAWRTVPVRRRTGTKRVMVRGRWVDQPVYTTVNRRVKHALSKADRTRLASVNRTLIARGEKLLALDIDADLRKEIHRRLARAESDPRRQAKLEEHVRRLVELDPSADELLQLLWDEGWGAWKNRDRDTARERFAFISRTYRSPGIRRQSTYWYARCLEESGERTEASRLYVQLQSTPYDDVYARFARERNREAAAAGRPEFVPFGSRADNWMARAEREMPSELRLAWELSLLGLDHDARSEIRKNSTASNRSWAYSILARIHRNDGSRLLVGHALRQAWPQIRTVELDAVPVHFLRMYYPTAYHDVVEREAARRGLDAALVKALILQESAYDPTARSSAGAVGLMQLMPPTAREIAGRGGREWDAGRLVDPEYNVEIGTHYLETLLSQLQGNRILSLAAYNGGIGNVRRWLRAELKGAPPDEAVESIPFSETKGYVKRVILYSSVYERLEGAADAAGK